MNTSEKLIRGISNICCNEPNKYLLVFFYSVYGKELNFWIKESWSGGGLATYLMLCQKLREQFCNWADVGSHFVKNCHLLKLPQSKFLQFLKCSKRTNFAKKYHSNWYLSKKWLFILQNQTCAQYYEYNDMKDFVLLHNEIFFSYSLNQITPSNKMCVSLFHLTVWPISQSKQWKLKRVFAVESISIFSFKYRRVAKIRIISCED